MASEVTDRASDWKGLRSNWEGHKGSEKILGGGENEKRRNVEIALMTDH